MPTVSWQLFAVWFFVVGPLSMLITRWGWMVVRFGLRERNTSLTIILGIYVIMFGVTAFLSPWLFGWVYV